MVTARRAAVRALVAIGTTAGVDAPARVSPSPSVSPSTYVPPEEPTLVAASSPDCATNPPGSREPTIEIDTLTPLCEAGVVYLDYGVRVTGTTASTATLTWHDPGGEDVVMSGQPLRGRVLWPGAYPQRFVDLPAPDGWQLVDNMWQNTRDFGWAVGTVDVTLP